MKDHKIQLAPSYNSAKKDPIERTRSKTKNTMKKQKDEESNVTVTSQIWQKNGSCPKGTVPVRRVPKKELLKARSFDEYGRKKPNFLKRQVNHRRNNNLDSFVQQQNHSVSFCNTLLVVEATNSTT